MEKRQQQEMGLVSIIIPAYNAAPYIEACLKSIYSQTYVHYEIIIAFDEKSSDDTLNILNSLSSTYPHVLDIGTDKGSGDARNRGLKLARGEFIVFVDADDELLPDYLSTMYNMFKQNEKLDVVSCNYQVVSENNVRKYRNLATKTENKTWIYNQSIALRMKLQGKLPAAPWTWMVRHQFLHNYNIHFPNYSHGDDGVYTWKLVRNSECIGYCNKKLYLFIQRSTSITHTPTDKWWDNYHEYRVEVFSLLDSTAPVIATDFLIKEIRWLAYSYACKSSYQEFRSGLRRYGVYHLSFLKSSDTIPDKVAVICFAISKRLYYLLIRYWEGRKNNSQFL